MQLADAATAISGRIAPRTQEDPYVFTDACPGAFVGVDPG